MLTKQQTGESLSEENGLNNATEMLLSVMVYTTNFIDRVNKSAGRTLKIRGAFPDGESVIA